MESAALNTEQFLDGIQTFKLAATHQSGSGFPILGSRFSISSELEDVEKSAPDTVKPWLKCWKLFRPFARSQKFDWFQTLRNKSQKHATRCANGRNNDVYENITLKIKSRCSNFITLISSRSIRQMLAIFC